MVNFNMAHNFNFFQWNCRGLKGNREEIEILINKYAPAAFCIQETKLKKGDEQTFKKLSRLL